MISMIAFGVYDVVLASRILGKRASRRHAPLQVPQQSLSDLRAKFAYWSKVVEYHTGYRAFSRQVLQSLPLEENSDDFVFDIKC